MLQVRTAMDPRIPPLDGRKWRLNRREVIERAASEVFAERGYHGASLDEICRRSGVTPPVLYDHFASKLDLHKHLLERTRDELLQVWREHLAGDEPAAVRIPRALDALGELRAGTPLRTANVLHRGHR